MTLSLLARSALALLVSVATPIAFVVTGVAGATIPPASAAKLTAAPATALPNASTTFTDGGRVTAAPAVAV